jgi:hypothetical protein
MEVRNSLFILDLTVETKLFRGYNLGGTPSSLKAWFCSGVEVA